VTAATTLGLRDLARFDFRVRDDGEPFFIEVNALPSLEPGASMYVAAAMQGLGSVESVLDVVVRSAAQRYGIALSTRTRRKKLRVGLLFNLKRASPSEDDDTEAEYDSPQTIAAIHEAIESHGHEVVELEAMPELPRILPEAGIDLAFNISEGIRGRNRESQVPAILELLDIAYTGSDPAALSLALDKGLAKRVVAQAGLRTPPHVAMRSGKERLPPDFRFPAIVKPVHEGSSKGVDARCVVETEAEARSLAREMAARYRQPALVESFVSGREFTVALLGETRPKVLPPMEIVFLGQEKYPIYAYAHKLAWSESVRYDAPANVEPGLRRELERMARGAFMALGCRDVARVDLRLDDQGRPCFIECNPLPGLTPDWSDLCIIANASGLGYRALIGEILAPAIRRLRARNGSRSSVW
jgi:D-alanine-D-alanine ligase